MLHPTACPLSFIYHQYLCRPPLVLLGVAGIFAGMILGGAGRSAPPATTRTAPATKAASTPAAASSAARILQADDLLANFPRNVKLARNERVTVQGRVLDVRSIATTLGATVRLALVGNLHAEDDPAHITCTIDKDSQAAALALQPDAIVQLSGTFGGTVTNADRLDLTACHDLSALTASTQLAAPRIVGRWRGNLFMSDQAFKTWTAKAGWIIGQVNPGTVLTPMLIDLTLEANGTATEIIHDPQQSFATFTGTWSVAQTAGGPKLKLNLKGLEPFETDVALEGKVLKFSAPGLAEMLIIPTVGCTRIYGTPLPEDLKALRNQAAKWVGANIGLANPQKLLADTNKFLDNCEQIEREFSLYFDGGLLKSKKSTQVCCINGKMFLFEFTPDQTQRTGIPAMSTEFKDIRLHFTLAAPEIKVESLTLDMKNTLPLSTPLTGKISLRSLHLIPDVKYQLILSHERGFSVCYLDKAPGPDNETFAFKFTPLGNDLGNAFKSGKSVPICFGLARNRVGEDRSLQVSEPIGMLVDVTP